MCRAPRLRVRAADLRCPVLLCATRGRPHALRLFRSERMRRFCGRESLQILLSCRIARLSESTQHHTSHRGSRDASHNVG